MPVNYIVGYKATFPLMIKRNDNRFKNHNDTINKWKHTIYKTFQYVFA